MTKVNWIKDYQREFICPYCNTKGMITLGRDSSTIARKMRFTCPTCNKSSSESSNINIQASCDPINQGIIWYTGYRIEDFICHKCHNRSVYFNKFENNKTLLFCRNCKSSFINSCAFNNQNISQYSSQTLAIKEFIWSEDRWDLRAINSKFDDGDMSHCRVNFTTIAPDWFRHKAKKYVEYLCVAESPPKTINNILCILRQSRLSSPRRATLEVNLASKKDQ